VQHDLTFYRQSRIIRGTDSTPYVLLAGWPSDDWNAVIAEVQHVLEWAHQRLTFRKANRRGPHYDTIGLGPSMGGGQTGPKRLKAGDEGTNGEVLDEVRSNWAVKRVARYHDRELFAISPTVASNHA
jgi:hypothetical protein